MSLVLDSSMTLGWLYADERTPAAVAIANRIAEFGCCVPAIWRLEIANSLQSNIRRGRINEEFRDRCIAELSSLAIEVDTETDRFAWSTTLALSTQFRLTLYDASYLELARRREMSLASLDKDLRAAAQSLGVELLGG